MKNMLTKTMKTFLVIAILTTMFNVNGVFANEVRIDSYEIDGIQINVLRDDDKWKIVESTESGLKTTATLDKLNNILTLSSSGEDVILDLNELTKIEDTKELELSMMSTLVENTFSNYEYTIYLNHNPRTWQLRRPNPESPLTSTFYKNVTQTVANINSLENFKQAVDNINDLEFTFVGLAIGVSLVTMITVILTAISGGVAASAGLVAIGLSGTALQVALDIERNCKNAHYYYFSV